MKRFCQDDALCMATRRIDLRPALTPMEASMLPAAKPACRGALQLVRASFAPGLISARRSASGRHSLRR